jgi:16S rRNA (cytidine1402-2'-O)-methyltransferase
MASRLFLIPTALSNKNPTSVLLQADLLSILHLKHFVVETPKVARVHLKALGLTTPLQKLNLIEIGKHKNTLVQVLLPMLKEFDVGLMSDCGLPAIADPGSEVIKLAHSHGIQVIPLSGPSSLMMALMASGINGQSFAFVGYLPINKEEREQKINLLQAQINRYNQTQIIIEAPFRNQSLLVNLINSLEKDTILCIAINLMEQEQKIISKPIFVWQKNPLPEVNKNEVVFVIGRN